MMTSVKAKTGEGSSALELSFRSVKGREIKAYIFNPDKKPTTLIIGGIHGDENSGVSLAHSLLREIRHRFLSGFPGGIIIIPVANPDGLAAKTRGNARGIDINRNFPTGDFRSGFFRQRFNPGKRAASEPETRAILEVASRFRPDLILTFHAAMGCVNYDGPAKGIAKRLSAKNGLPVLADLGYPTPGSMGTYFGRERGIPIITLELLPGEDQWRRHGEAILGLLYFGIKETECGDRSRE